MSDMNFRITFDLGPILDMAGTLSKQTGAALHHAVHAVAQQVAIDWKTSVQRAKLWSGEKDAYAKSITWAMTGDYTAEVVASYNLASEIENGRPARDLKRMLNTSLKVRISKDGARYLYIPFRHNVPGKSAHGQAMPAEIHQQAKQLAPSRVTGSFLRPSATGAYGVKNRKQLTVKQKAYSWGDSLPAGLSEKLKPHHATDPHAGMYRFDTSTPGGAKSSQYLTFRTMSERSKGWIIPPQPGQKIAQGVQEDLAPKASETFTAALQATLDKA